MEPLYSIFWFLNAVKSLRHIILCLQDDIISELLIQTSSDLVASNIQPLLLWLDAFAENHINVCMSSL